MDYGRHGYGHIAPYGQRRAPRGPLVTPLLGPTGQGSLGAFSISKSKEAELQTLARQQRKLYESGSGVASLSNEHFAEAMYQGVYSDAQARIRVAFWLYVGARVLLGKGQGSQAKELAVKAYEQYHAAEAEWLPDLIPFLESSASSSAKATTILANGASWADRYGLSDIAAILRGQATPKAIQAAQQQRVEDHPLTAIAENAIQAATGQKTPWALYILGGGALLAAVLFFGRPYLQAAQQVLPSTPPPK